MTLFQLFEIIDCTELTDITDTTAAMVFHRFVIAWNVSQLNLFIISTTAWQK